MPLNGGVDNSSFERRLSHLIHIRWYIDCSCHFTSEKWVYVAYSGEPFLRHEALKASILPTLPREGLESREKLEAQTSRVRNSTSQFPLWNLSLIGGTKQHKDNENSINEALSPIYELEVFMTARRSSTPVPPHLTRNSEELERGPVIRELAIQGFVFRFRFATQLWQCHRIMCVIWSGDQQIIHVRILDLFVFRVQTPSSGHH